MPDVDLGYAIGLKPEEAIRYFREKGYAFAWNWQEMWQEAHAKAFTVAKVTQLDILEDIRGAVQKALDEGTTLRDFQKNLTPILQAKGWWGKQEVPDLAGATQEVQLGSPRRLKTIYRTNLQTSFMAGRWKEQLENADDRPYLQYVAVMDRRTRPSHARLHGRVFRYDDPFWKAFYPPNGWGCRCRTRALSESNVQARGLTVHKTDPAQIRWEDRIINRAGEMRPVAVYRDLLLGRFETDPGWSYNPGEAKWNLEDLLQQRLTRKKAARKPRAPKKTTPAGFNPEDLQPIPDSRKGSMPGGLYENSQGQRYYVKFYQDPNHARSEFAANAIYRKLGVEVPELRLAEMAAPGGERKLALISTWRDDLKRIGAADMVKHPEELARIFQASALVKNWDVVGLEYDNLLLAKNGRLVLIDSGGSLRFRAQGGAKAFEDIPLEVKSFRDLRLNQQSAKVFNEAFGKDAWLEARGAEPLLGLEKAAVRKIFREAGFDASEVDSLTDTLWKRRQWLIDRYDIENKLVPQGFGKHLEEFKKWGTTAWTPNEVGGLVNGAVERGFAAEVEALVGKFEAYVNSTIHPWGRGVLRNLFREWSFGSSSEGGATIKLWTESRFGKLTKYHSGRTSRREVSSALDDGIRRSLENARIPRETVFELLDAEYEFQQYLMRRLHGYDEITAIRFMSRSEFASSFKRGAFSGNSVQSVTVKSDGFGGQRIVRMYHRVENTIKTYYQGLKYMHFGRSESEYIVIGRAVRADVIR
ncbi:MAG: hypothetical protein CVU61_02125 [Deltaproteobacteria bacterium HGW-Deltaproteobacteria-19]|jgi:SPP1 gp7 family putative phage head morphogenesis protein|nr:MAG: hypothetical protein CVU61_02125 [Deltaproteobacteria bacterium HGW-Deltaproteobacteria-19]